MEKAKTLDIKASIAYDKRRWGCSSAGEHLVRNEGATGSIPVTSTIQNQQGGFQ